MCIRDSLLKRTRDLLKISVVGLGVRHDGVAPGVPRGAAEEDDFGAADRGRGARAPRAAVGVTLARRNLCQQYKFVEGSFGADMAISGPSRRHGIQRVEIMPWGGPRAPGVIWGPISGHF